MKMWLVIFDVAPVAILYFCSQWLYDVDPYERGFFCSDETIRHPYKDSTVSSELYQSVCYGGALILTLLVEFLRVYHFNEKSSKVLRFLWSVYTVLLAFMFGITINELMTTVSKISVGRLRPHFLEVCNPNMSFNIETCGTYLDPIYITDFECLGSEKFETPEEKISSIKDARRSFLSGHASTTVYSMVFIILYLQFRLNISLFAVLRSFVQVSCAGFAFFTCLSRISDYKHHPEDVIAGILLGSVVAVFTIFSIIPNNFLNTKQKFERKTYSVEEEDFLGEVNIFEKKDYESLP